MCELTIGSRFYYKGKLCEVAEFGCSSKNCVFKNTNKCNKAKCSPYQRNDRKQVHFKEVKE